MRILASVFEMPIEVPEIPEPSLLGSAMLAWKALGILPDLSALPPGVPVRVYSPVEDWIPVYAEQFARFQAVLANLEAAFQHGGSSEAHHLTMGGAHEPL
jgi:Sugar (pentulose and hexulose) kinases